MKEMKDFKFIIIILLTFFGVGIMAEIDNHDYNVNNTGIMYQENDNIVLNENNRYYDYDIDFNLNESYLHYSPVKKGGLLDSLYNDKSNNLAIPGLTGKEYLGNGTYILSPEFQYNVYNGNYVSNVNGFFAYTFPVEIGKQYTLSSFYISGITNTIYRVMVDGSYISFNIMTNQVITFTPTNSSSINIGQSSSAINDNLTFKLQLEKGTTATPYQVPYIPALQIAFNGTNQVEYINPFEEQIIEINDINNVNNIDFELLNTKNPVVFNWNITTNPNMPFVRFYNNQTKLLYDFTDVKEMNNIGNRLMISNSGIFPTIKGALDIVDLFYKGFQQLFNKQRINSIIDYLKIGWPALPPILPISWR